MSSQSSWLTEVDPKELRKAFPALATLDLGIAATVDDVAHFFVQGGTIEKHFTHKPPAEPEEDDRPPERYWGLFKKEFYSFLCTKDPKYDDLRAKLDAQAGRGAMSIITVIAAFIADKLGTVAGSLVGFCAVCLYGVLKIGKEAMCASFAKDGT